MIRHILIADNSGFCFGVKRAVDITTSYNQSKKSNNTYTLGPLIHNDDAVHRLEEQGIRRISIDEIDKLKSGDAVVIRSHGVAPEIIEEINKTGAKIIDATCPYVGSIQRKARKYHEKGYQIVIVGDSSHPEVIGINGWCGDTAIVTKDGSDLSGLPDKVCIVSQTTERLCNYEKAVDAVMKMSSDVIAFNTICSATKERQESADEVSKKVEIMIVIGGKNSSNSKKLYEICRKNCENTIFIENISELPEWVILGEKPGIEKVGITAGASTPDWIIAEVVDALRGKDKENPDD